MSVRMTTLGSWPGTDFAAVQRMLFGELPDMPHLAELPARGVWSGMIGRTIALVEELGFDLQPAGWRITDAPGIDHRRARARWREDLDLLEEVAQGYAGPFKIAVTGPWTLAALVERPRGDRVLADHGARRDLAMALAEGTASLLRELRRRLPTLAPVLQLDEPMLPAVAGGRVSTASGFSRFRSVDTPELWDALTAVLDGARAAYAAASGDDALAAALHCCAGRLDPELAYRAGFDAVALPAALLTPTALDRIGLAVEAGRALWLGVAATDVPDRVPRPDDLARSALDLLRPLELGDVWVDRLLLTPACGLAGWSPRPALALIRHLREAADIVEEALIS